MQQYIRLQVCRRDLGVAEADEDQRRAGRPRHPGVGGGIAHHDCARQVAAHGLHGLDQVGGRVWGR